MGRRYYAYSCDWAWPYGASGKVNGYERSFLRTMDQIMKGQTGDGWHVRFSSLVKSSAVNMPMRAIAISDIIQGTLERRCGRRSTLIFNGVKIRKNGRQEHKLP